MITKLTPDTPVGKKFRIVEPNPQCAYGKHNEYNLTGKIVRVVRHDNYDNGLTAMVEHEPVVGYRHSSIRYGATIEMLDEEGGEKCE